MQTEIATDRLMLRRLRPADLDGFHALVSDFDVVRNTATWPWPPDRDLTRARCHPIDPALGMAGPVFHAGVLVGTVGLTLKAGRPEMGYMFARAHWGRGFATEIGRALIAHVWARYDWPVLAASVFLDNPASVRVLEKLGFEEDAPGEGPCLARGGDFALRRFRLARPAPIPAAP